MVFSSIIFLLYFLPIFLLGYIATPNRFKNLTLLLGSILFYAWGAPKFVFVLFFTTFIDFFMVQWMSQSDSDRKRKLLLICSLCINVGLLFYFKYSNFFIENLNLFLGSIGISSISWTKLILPVGISFYTFETITYVVDVYRKVHQPLKRFWDFQLYIFLFPKLIAGPIIRYHDLADQIDDRSARENANNRLQGFYRFTIGLSKKVLLANVLGSQADTIFQSEISNLDSYTAWIGIISYTFQIYFDFSGYSDMAIGLGKMLGFQFPENFNNPYTSRSITEFWRRWHMTLGSWMRNYLYIPLGGNRVHSTTRLYINLWLVFLVSGLWHGASWNFVFWGAFHGFFLVIERAFLKKWLERWGAFISIFYTFLTVNLGWIFFRSENFSHSWKYISRLFSNQWDPVIDIPDYYWFYFSLAVLFSFFTVFTKSQKIQDAIFESNYGLKKHSIMFPVSMLLLVFSISSITSFGFNPFIYFRF